KILFVFAIALEFVFVPLFLKAMWPNKTKKSLALKMVCTTLFVLVGLLAVQITGNTSGFALLMMLGLILGATGDFFLHVSPKPASLVTGAMSFLAGHLVYIFAFRWVMIKYIPDVNFISPLEIAVIALVYVGFIGYSFYKGSDFGAMLIPVVFYAAVLITTFVKASVLGVRLLAASVPNAAFMSGLLMSGALLFFISDTLWSVINFNGHKKNRPLKYVNIITYYGAQILLACTILVIS
ncbi:MAG TPA: lysoplasmalogenase family protein, partial [Clostridia bacterium]|nr:lysoplasmalogenase family protein [Clostridia bacterium]